MEKLLTCGNVERKSCFPAADVAATHGSLHGGAHVAKDIVFRLLFDIINNRPVGGGTLSLQTTHFVPPRVGLMQLAAQAIVRAASPLAA